jgi:hypothetical protein
VKLAFLFPGARVFEEMRESYTLIAKEFGDGTIDVLGPQDEASIPRADEDTTFVCFHRPSAATLQQSRKAKVLFVYCEPLGPVTGMTGDGRAYMESLRQVAHLFDGILVHTPDMRTLMRITLAGWGVNIPVGVFEAGLHRNVTVAPDYSTPKDIEFLFYGAMAGKRQWSVPLLKERLGSRLVIADNCYGKDLGRMLNRSKVSLYIAHSDVTSFSTWRIWQTAATSAALAIECLDGQEADAYPLEPYRDYLPLPKLMRDSIDEFVAKLDKFVTPNPPYWDCTQARGVVASTYYDATACLGRLGRHIGIMFNRRWG